MNKTELLHIIQKYKRGETSENESIFVEAYYDLFEIQDNVSEEELNKLEDQLLVKIWDQIAEKEPKRPEKKHRIYFYITRVAAAILVVLGIGFLWSILNNNSQQEKESLVSKSSSIIRPASHRAILTLTNGDKVELDSGSKQLLKGRAKQDSGKLVYLAGKTNSSQKITSNSKYNMLMTPRGAKYSVVLSDGTKVWMNAGSSLKYPVSFNGKDRVVKLEGEAYFEVASQEGHPFKVRVRGSEIQVLGTHFNINAYDKSGKVKTTLSEGSVKVVKGESSRLLKTGQQAIVEKNNIEVSNVNVDKVLAWTNNLFYFYHTDIKEIMEELSRWYDVDIVYEKEENTKDLNFNGIMSRYNDIGAVLKRLSLTGTVHFKMDGRKLIVEE